MNVQSSKTISCAKDLQRNHSIRILKDTLNSGSGVPALIWPLGAKQIKLIEPSYVPEGASLQALKLAGLTLLREKPTSVLKL